MLRTCGQAQRKSATCGEQPCPQFVILTAEQVGIESTDARKKAFGQREIAAQQVRVAKAMARLRHGAECVFPPVAQVHLDRAQRTMLGVFIQAGRQIPHHDMRSAGFTRVCLQDALAAVGLGCHIVVQEHQQLAACRGGAGVAPPCCAWPGCDMHAQRKLAQLPAPGARHRLLPRRSRQSPRIARGLNVWFARWAKVRPRVGGAWRVGTITLTAGDEPLVIPTACLSLAMPPSFPGLFLRLPLRPPRLLARLPIGPRARRTAAQFVPRQRPRRRAWHACRRAQQGRQLVVPEPFARHQRHGPFAAVSAYSSSRTHRPLRHSRRWCGGVRPGCAGDGAS